MTVSAPRLRLLRRPPDPAILALARALGRQVAREEHERENSTDNADAAKLFPKIGEEKS